MSTRAHADDRAERRVPPLRPGPADNLTGAERRAWDAFRACRARQPGVQPSSAEVAATMVHPATGEPVTPQRARELLARLHRKGWLVRVAPPGAARPYAVAAEAAAVRFLPDLLTIATGLVAAADVPRDLAEHRRSARRVLGEIVAEARDRVSHDRAAAERARTGPPGPRASTRQTRGTDAGSTGSGD